MKISRYIWIMAAMCMLMSPEMDAAGTKGRLVVKIKDVAGNPIESAKITLTNVESTALTYTIETNSKGIALIAGIEPSRYQVVVEKDGYRTISTEGDASIKLRVGIKVTKEWTMKTEEQFRATVLENIRLNEPDKFNEIQANEANNRGVDAYEKGDLEEARKQFKIAVKYKDDIGYFPHLVLGNLAFSDHNLDAATQHLERARELDTEGLSIVDICRLLGACYQIAQETDKAYEVWTELVEKAPENPDANVLHNLAAIDFQRKNTDKAIEWLEICRVKHPDYVDGLDLLGSLYLQKTDYEKALAVYKEYLTALEAAPEKDDAKIADARNMVKMLAEELKN